MRRRASLVALVALLVALVASIAYALPASPPSPFQRLALPAGSAVDADRSAVTLGVRFASATDGFVTGVEFRRDSTANTGKEVQLWDSTTRAKLATSSRIPVGTGLVHQWFDEPVAVTAGHEYVASYLAPVGRYNAKAAVHTVAQTSGALTAPVNAGVYAYGAAATFPAGAYNGTDYQVTPVFVANLPATPTGTPTPTTTASATPTPTPTPTSPPPASGELAGWQVTPSNVGLAPFGLSCATLPLYTGPKDVPAGTTLSNVRIEKMINLFAGNITLSKVCVQPTDAAEFHGWEPVVSNNNWNGDLAPSSAPVRVFDSEIDASKLPVDSIGGTCAFHGVGDIERNYVHGMGTGICFRYTWNAAYDAVAVNNYVGGLRNSADSHNEAATIRDFNRPAQKVVYRGNYLDSEGAVGHESGALFIQAIDGPINNVYLDNNLFKSRGYDLTLYDNAYTYGSNVNAVNNRFVVDGYGPVAITGVGFNQWAENYVYDPAGTNGKGAVVAKP